MTVIQDHMIGGAKVQRGFQRGSEWVKPGTDISRNELLSMPRGNLQAMVDGGRIQLYPPTPAMLGGVGELHMISRGFGKYDIIEGRVLNEEPYTSKEAAETAYAEMMAKAGRLPGEVSAEPEMAPAPN